MHALNDTDVPFIVVGGLAVNAHGYGRATHNVDLVVRLVPEAVTALFAALGGIGYRTLVPVDAAEFADAGTRGQLIAEKGMAVLQAADLPFKLTSPASERRKDES